MLGYGFAIPSNPFDHFSVGLGVPPGSPLAETRAWSPEKKRQEDFQCYIFNIDHFRAKSASCLEASVFSFDLLDSISVLCANDRELQAMFELRKTYISAKLATKTRRDNRNLLHTLAQLYRECQQRLSRLQASDPQLNGEVARTAQQRYAQIYRESQMEILATAMLLCRYTLLRARMNQSTDEVLKRARAGSQLKQPATSNLDTLVQRYHTSLTQTHELFSFTELSELLPAGISAGLLSLRETLEQDTLETQRARLAVLVAFLRNAKLPPRYQAWIDRLDEWYDSSWGTMGAEHGEEGESVRSLLAECAELAGQACHGQSRPSADLERLIWAWNVIEEESVRIPKGLLSWHNGDGDGDGDGENEESLLLYIPR